ncbi:MAG: hypothetical protein WC668_02245 [Patescibacteria group bacterium]|jgi:hypothetical protein
MRIAAISVGLQGHGHNLAFAPNAIVTVAAAVQRVFGDKVQIRVFDEVLFGHDQLKELLSVFTPNVLFVSVPVTGYYYSALDIYNWAKEHAIPVLTGGYHFNIPDVDYHGNQVYPGVIARLATEREVFVCYADGESTAVGFVEHLFNPNHRKLASVPNLCYVEAGQLIVTPRQENTLGTQAYPNLPLESFDPRAYWGSLSKSDVHASGKDLIGNVPIGRTIVGAKIVEGCTYRRVRLSQGKEACSYCTLTSPCHASSGQSFWRITQEMYDYVESISWSGDQGVRCYQIGDDMGSDIPLIKSIWESRPPWANEVPLGHRVYAWHVLGEDQARMLYDIGVRWIYLGGDGKRGFTNEWSVRHPLVRTLENCRKHGLRASIGFVLGQRNQDWHDIEKWSKFSQRLAAEYGDSLIIVDGWVNVLAPGSPDWAVLCQYEPSFGNTDCPDLEKARMVFWQQCTKLCDHQNPEDIRRLLYEWVPQFENDMNRHPGVQRSFMLRP